MEATMLLLDPATVLTLLLGLALCTVATRAEAHGRCAKISDGTIYGDLGEPLEECSYLYAVTMEAAPEDAELVDGVWFDGEGDQLGPVIWGEFAITHERLVDPCGRAAELALPR
jgi:hypothetical protein